MVENRIKFPQVKVKIRCALIGKAFEFVADINKQLLEEENVFLTDQSGDIEKKFSLKTCEKKTGIFLTLKNMRKYEIVPFQIGAGVLRGQSSRSE